MRAKRVAVCRKRMLEVVGRVVTHAETLHDPPRTFVADRREGNDFVEAQLIEGEGDGCASAFGRIAASPVLACEAPADLDGGREVGVEARLCKANEADELSALDELRSPQPPSALRDQHSLALGDRIAVLAREQGREMAHHLRIGVQRCERLEIGVAPLPEHETRRPQLAHGARA